MVPPPGPHWRRRTENERLTRLFKSPGGRTMDADLVIRGGTVVDGTGAPARTADVAIAGDRIVAVEDRTRRHAPRREIDAEGRVVTPGFVDIHTHLDAQLAWDPLPTSSCWHGVTSVVLGNCGVTFAPVGPGEREFLAEMMESVEDIPRGPSSRACRGTGRPTASTSAGSTARPRASTSAAWSATARVRVAAMGERSMDEGSGDGRRHRRACASWSTRRCGAGALGFSTCRTLCTRVPDGRPVPGHLGRRPTSCWPSATCSARRAGRVRGRHAPRRARRRGARRRPAPRWP